MSDNTSNTEKSFSNETETGHVSRPPPITRSASVPHSPTTPLANNPWYRQKFEMVKLRNEKIC